MSYRQHQYLAYAAIAAIWLIYLADLAIDIRSMFDEGFWQPMAGLALWRVYFASAALLLFPLVSGGLYVLNRGLKQLWLCLLLFFTFSTLCIYLQSSYFFFARASTWYASASGSERVMLAGLLAEYSSFKNLFGAAFLAVVALASLWLAAVVALGKTVFPPYFALLSPLTGTLLSILLKNLAPVVHTAAYPLILPSFWMAMLMTVYLLYVLRLEQNPHFPASGAHRIHKKAT